MDGFDLVCILSMKRGLFVDGINYFLPFILYCINLP